jgi:drug/metabolite transporter (DMT)-like permease
MADCQNQSGARQWNSATVSGLFRAHLALISVNVIYGLNYLVAKGLMPGLVGPSGFILFRVGGSLFLFASAFFAIRAFFGSEGNRLAGNANRFWPERRDWARLLFCALFGVTVNQLLFFNGLSLTSPLNSAIIMTSNPILVLLLSAVVLGDRITGRKALGLGMGVAGAVTLILISAGAGSGTSSIQGDLMVLGNSASYALYLIAVRPLMERYGPMHLNALTFALGGLMALPFGIGEAMAVDFGIFSQRDVLSFAYVIVCSTFLAYLFNMLALRHVSPLVSSVYINLQPVMAGLFSWILSAFWPENYAGDITAARVICAVVIGWGVWLVSRPGRARGSLPE